MAEESDDPREIAWHPRFASRVIGHDAAEAQFKKAFSSGKPHHAWLIHGAKGVGKATLAYHLAAGVLGGSGQTHRWIEGRAHPDLYVLERQLNDAKPRKLRAEISVDDARGLGHFFARTASGNWRVAIIDAADDLNAESANAILKLVEEPPPKAVILLLAHQPGKLLRTLRSRCLRLGLKPLFEIDVFNIINDLPLDSKPELQELRDAAEQSGGSPGQALALLGSPGAKAFGSFIRLARPKSSDLLAIANQFAGKGAGPDEFQIFTSLLLNWLAETAKHRASASVAKVHATISENARVAVGFNLDRRQAVMAQLQAVNDALKAS